MANGYGGKRAGAGRKKGSTKSLETAQQRLTKAITTTSSLVPFIEPEITALSPLEVMHIAMAWHAQNGDWSGAHSCAKDIAPYMHTRLNAVTIATQEATSTRDLTTEELLAKIARLKTIEATIIEEEDGE